VSPANAKLAIDDSEVAGNPFMGNFRSDAAVHHVRASAPGYITKSLPIELDDNVSLDLSLERVATPVRITSTRPARQAPPTRPAAARPSAPSRPLEPPRRIEQEPEPAPARPAPVAPPAIEPRPAAPRTVTPTEVDPAGGNKPRRTIDPANPYGGEE
jgi:serine/threonine-protein kinase